MFASRFDLNPHNVQYQTIIITLRTRTVQVLLITNIVRVIDSQIFI
jgi:hypothetical protein